MTAPVFVVGTAALTAAAVGSTVRLDGAEGRHAVAVRRLGVGEPVVLTDGEGLGVSGSVAEVVGKDVLEVRVAEALAEPEPALRVVVVQALPKGDRGLKALGKWRATAREAGKQSRRLRFPVVRDPMSTRQVAELLSGAALGAVLHEEGALPLASAGLPVQGDLVLVVGPEGGVSPDELARFAEAGAAPYRLGSTVLRTSTAGVAAGALLLGRTGRWG